MSGRFVLQPGRAAYVWVTLAVLGSSWFSVVVDDPNRPAPPWAALAATVFGLAVFWPGREMPRDRRFLSLLPTFYVAFIGGALLTGIGFWHAAWMSLVNLLAAVPMAWYHRRKNSIDDWAPGSAVDAVRLCVIYGLASGAVVALQGLPLVGYPHIRAAGGLTAYLAAALLLQVSTRRSVNRTRLRPGDALMAVAALACAVLPYLVPQYPLSWIVFVPALWLGLTFPPRVVATVAASGLLISIVASSAPYWRTSVDINLPPYVFMQALQYFAAVFALIISYQREDAARLSSELTSRRMRAATDNAILDGVFRAMHDGVMVADPDGVVLMTNQAARTLLGTARPGPGAEPAQRVAAALGDLRQAEGSGRLAPGEVERLLTDSGDGTPVNVFQIDRDGSRRRSLSLASLPISLSRRPHRLILIRDVSSLQQRQHQLKSFARAVAGDLSEPLESLSQAIAVTQDLLWDDDAEGGRAALRKTIRATAGIRHLIDDHIAATLAREGVLRPTPIELATLVRDAAWASDQDGIALDVRTPHTVFADRSLTHQLVSNLILGAVERAQEGQRAAVRVVSEPADEPGWVNVTFAERDLGPRSYAEPRPPVPRGDSAEAFAGDRRLSLCHTIVARHGGRMVAVPNELGGATITLTLPTA